MELVQISSLEELPELPRYKLDENEQIVLDDVISTENEQNVENTESNINKKEIIKEAPMPEREDMVIKKMENYNKKMEV